MRIISNKLARGRMAINHLSIIKPPIVSRLVVPHGGKSRLLNIQKILFCQAEGNYTAVQLCDGQSVLVSKCLKEIMMKLPNSHFERIHQSYLVNINYIEVVGSDTVELQDYSRPLPLSRKHKKSLRLRLGC